MARKLPTDVGVQLVEPVVDGVLHRTFAKHTVREIFSTHRADIQKSLTEELGGLFARWGDRARGLLGTVDLPTEYKNGLEALLAEELHAEKMRYTWSSKRR